MRLICVRSVFLLAAALLAQPPEIERLNAQLLASRSATQTLETWCKEPGIQARVLKAAPKPATGEQRRRLEVTATEPVSYRRVELRCGDRVYSEADNWYVPGRLTGEMKRLLETTDTPFGKAVAPLDPYRKTLAVKKLWPEALFEHRAVLYTREHKPFSEVREVYQRAILNGR